MVRLLSKQLKRNIKIVKNEIYVPQVRIALSNLNNIEALFNFETSNTTLKDIRITKIIISTKTEYDYNGRS